MYCRRVPNESSALGRKDEYTVRVQLTQKLPHEKWIAVRLLEQHIYELCDFIGRSMEHVARKLRDVRASEWSELDLVDGNRLLVLDFFEGLLQGMAR